MNPTLESYVLTMGHEAAAVRIGSMWLRDGRWHVRLGDRPSHDYGDREGAELYVYFATHGAPFCVQMAPQPEVSSASPARTSCTRRGCR